MVRLIIDLNPKIMTQALTETVLSICPTVEGRYMYSVLHVCTVYMYAVFSRCTTYNVRGPNIAENILCITHNILHK